MRAITAIVILSAVVAIAPPAPALSQQPATVTVQDFEFRPTPLRIATGTAVRWGNNGPSTHTITADRGAFDSGRVGPRGTFSFTFNSEGTIEYHCEIHQAMRGQIIVEQVARDPYNY